jgi:hypothetical protein
LPTASALAIVLSPSRSTAALSISTDRFTDDTALQMTLSDGRAIS